MDVMRTRKYRQPTDYLNITKPFLASTEQVSNTDLLFEFMLNTTRLQEAIPNALFTERTGLAFKTLEPRLLVAKNKGLITLNNHHWQVTCLGRRYTNDLQALFLAE